MAEKLYVEALTIRRGDRASETTDVAVILGNLGNVLFDRGKLEDAIVSYHQAAAIHRRVLGSSSFRLGIVLTSLGEAQLRRGDLMAAREALDEALEIKRSVYGPNHARTAVTLALVGEVRVASGDVEAGIRELRQAILDIENDRGVLHWMLTEPLNALSRAEQMRGRFDFAEAAAMRAIAVAVLPEGRNDLRLASALVELAQSKSSAGSVLSAADLTEEVRVALELLNGGDHPLLVRAREIRDGLAS